ncbi:MAG TPA: ferrous iron transport protein B [Pyrinomonadaceae bacterium]|jgi:ferrous iron transport protein B|nr:ferrous iron transport protein B [Pyrinomonadaceae bacterium]
MSTTLKSPSLFDQPSQKLERASKTLTIALAGNPNAGKTTLFNTLTGMRQKVANYPGVTVERKEGMWSLATNGAAPLAARVIDLPGLYSLDAASIDEKIARDVLTGRIPGLAAPDVVVAVVDATNLERNLYLTTQLLEYGRPLVIALTMVDLAARRGIVIDAEQLSRSLCVPVIPVVARERRGLDALAEAIINVAATGEARGPGAGWSLSDRAERELLTLAHGTEEEHTERHVAVRDLYGEELPSDARRREAIESARTRLCEADQNWWQEPLVARYDWIEQVVAQSVRSRAEDRHTRSASSATERIDHLVTHKIFGPLILIAVMLLVFQTIFSWASLPMDLIDKGFGTLGTLVRDFMPEGLLTDLLVDGVIAGVGGVLVFLPQILLLFFFITILEDTGYMARAAFLMDRLMRGVGLHGKAFMPLLSSFACAIPGIMATRTIENPKDRFATIMIAPFMSCSARLPVYALLIAAFFSTQKVFGVVSVGALMIVSMYLLGITVAVCVAWVLKHTILKAPPPPLVLELPPYRVPNPFTVAQAVWSRAWLFVRRAGTVILAISIILWALVTFPRAYTNSNQGAPARAEQVQESAASPEGTTTPASDKSAHLSDETGEQIRNSFAGRAGRFIEPLIAPLGFDWKMGIGLISSFAARETLVSTFSIVYNVGPDEGEDSPSLIDAVRNARRPDGTPAWTPLVAVSMMVFFVLACQCMSTVAVVRRETNSWRWPLFMVGYMLVLAYIASLITFQGGRLLGFT